MMLTALGLFLIGLIALAGAVLAERVAGPCPGGLAGGFLTALIAVLLADYGLHLVLPGDTGVQGVPLISSACWALVAPALLAFLWRNAPPPRRVP
jgi:hypothetical protein